MPHDFTSMSATISIARHPGVTMAYRPLVSGVALALVDCAGQSDRLTVSWIAAAVIVAMMAVGVAYNARQVVWTVRHAALVAITLDMISPDLPTIGTGHGRYDATILPNEPPIRLPRPYPPLSGIAQVLRDHVERIARFIPGDQQQAEVLIAVAVAALSDDNERAERAALAVRFPEERVKAFTKLPPCTYSPLKRREVPNGTEEISVQACLLTRLVESRRRKSNLTHTTSLEGSQLQGRVEVDRSTEDVRWVGSILPPRRFGDPERPRSGRRTDRCQAAVCEPVTRPGMTLLVPDRLALRPGPGQQCLPR